MKGWQVNYELERICKEAVVASFKVLLLHSPGQTEENHKESQSGQPVSEQRFEIGPTEYEAGVLTTQLRRSI
jgi:hypothetical protein